MEIATRTILVWTAGVILIELIFFAILLKRRGAFHWLSAGFWAWFAFGLYFVLVPISSVITGRVYDFQVRLVAGGGFQRGLWVLVVIFIGIMFFFSSYLKTSFKTIDFGLKNETFLKNPFFIYWLILFVGYGIYSLLASRAGLISWQGEEVISHGRFVGDVTGYQNVGYMLMIYPILVLLLAPHKFSRTIGMLLALAFIVLSLPHAWSRFATVSMLLSLTMWRVMDKSRRWPGLFALVGILLVTLAYQARGHSNWQFDEVPQAIVESLDVAVEKGATSFTESDTQMLATFWVESAWHDTWVGFDYGLRFLNYVMVGWIPGRLLPQKYFLVDWLSAHRPHYPEIFDRLLFGAKSTLIGSFYANGHLVAVVIQMALVGWFSRRLDGMTHIDSPIAVRALGIAWLSVLWMIWGSHDFWGLMLLGTISIPFWIGIPFFRLKKRLWSETSAKLPGRQKISRTHL